MYICMNVFLRNKMKCAFILFKRKQKTEFKNNTLNGGRWMVSYGAAVAVALEEKSERSTMTGELSVEEEGRCAGSVREHKT